MVKIGLLLTKRKKVLNKRQAVQRTRQQWLGIVFAHKGQMGKNLRFIAWRNSEMAFQSENLQTFHFGQKVKWGLFLNEMY